MTKPTPALLDDSAAADLRAKVDAAWEEFARALADIVGGLPAGERLEIALDPTASGTGEAVYEVALAADGDGVLAEAVGNASLPDGYRLDRSAIAHLVALGWSPPGVVDGTGDRFGLRLEPDDAERTAEIVTRTFRDVYGAPHPAFLTYAFEDPAADLPPLGTARPLPEVDPAPQSTVDAGGGLPDRVRVVVAKLLKSTPESLQVDSDGDINIRSGSAMVFVRILDNPPMVDVYSPVLTEVEANEKLYERLSQLTRRMPIGRLYCTEDTVWASVPVFGRDFQATHLMLAVQVMTRLADELDDRLQGDFGGRRFFGEGDKPVRTDEQRTGMYL